MCVEIERRVRPTRRVRVAWKSINSSSTREMWRPLVQSGYFPRGKWVRAQHANYGFNAYERKVDAERAGWSTAPIHVRVRLIEGYGSHGGHTVLFAREIFVPRGRK